MYATSWSRAISTSSMCTTGTEMARANALLGEFSTLRENPSFFYAYDLSDPRKLDAKVSFYVWGERLGAEKPIRSLGIFHNDDANDGRWVLTFDDPQVLAQINSVFVTVKSSKKTIKEPGGKRVLFAFLGEKPNHP